MTSIYLNPPRGVCIGIPTPPPFPKGKNVSHLGGKKEKEDEKTGKK
jgi:hypothetical protein